jgi:peptidyl-prolyl cis-trans isomerase SurA
VIRRLARPVLLVLALAGCSVPQWMPLIGGDKPPAKDEPPKAAAPPPTAAVPVRLSTTGQPQAPPDERVTDRVLAVVNNDAITLSEIQEAIAVYRYENRDRTTESSDRLVQQFLTRLIDSRLQVQEAEREKIVVDEAEIDEELADRIKKMNMKSHEEFEAALKAQGIPMAAVRKRIADELRRGRIVSRKVRLRVSVTEEEVTQYLEANRPKLETGLGYHARHILVLPDTGAEDAAWENARIRAELLRTQLLEGADFAEMAKQHSRDASARDGGDLGTLKRGELAQDIETQILTLTAGQISSPYRSALGYHIFRLESKETLEGDGLTRVRAQIREILFREKFDTRLDAWLREIKQRAVIDVRLDGQL